MDCCRSGIVFSFRGVPTKRPQYHIEEAQSPMPLPSEVTVPIDMPPLCVTPVAHPADTSRRPSQESSLSADPGRSSVIESSVFLDSLRNKESLRNVFTSACWHADPPVGAAQSALPVRSSLSKLGSSKNHSRDATPVGNSCFPLGASFMGPVVGLTVPDSSHWSNFTPRRMT